MLFEPIPEHLLIHEVVYHAPIGEDDGGMGDDETPEPQKMIHVRFEPTRKKITKTDNTEVLTNGVLYIDAMNSKPFIIPSESGQIEFMGSKLSIIQVESLYTDQLEPHHLEVMLQ